MLNLLKNTKLFSTEAALFYIPIFSVLRVQTSLHPHQHLLSFDASYPGRCEWCIIVVLLCSSLLAVDSEHLFMVDHLYTFREIPIRILCLFFNWFVFLLLNCKSSSYILETRSLWNTWFANIFSYSVGCLCALLMVSSDA